MGTDQDWERWGTTDPYFGVLTEDRFRGAHLDDAARRAFFQTGTRDVDDLLDRLTHHRGGDAPIESVLDFGCGVGRLTLAFAEHATTVVGVDVSAAMVTEARSNAASAGLTNVRFELCDGEFANAGERYDLVHSYIVLQHLPRRRGMVVVDNLIRSVAPGGHIALHLTFGPDRRDIPPSRALRGLVRIAKARRTGEPPMLMTRYDADRVLERFQEAGITELSCRLLDQDGARGLFVIGGMPG